MAAMPIGGFSVVGDLPPPKRMKLATSADTLSARELAEGKTPEQRQPSNKKSQVERHQQGSLQASDTLDSKTAQAPAKEPQQETGQNMELLSSVDVLAARKTVKNDNVHDIATSTTEANQTSSSSTYALFNGKNKTSAELASSAPAAEQHKSAKTSPTTRPEDLFAKSGSAALEAETKNEALMVVEDPPNVDEAIYHISNAAYVGLDFEFTGLFVEGGERRRFNKGFEQYWLACSDGAQVFAPIEMGISCYMEPEEDEGDAEDAEQQKNVESQKDQGEQKVRPGGTFHTYCWKISPDRIFSLEKGALAFLRNVANFSLDSWADTKVTVKRAACLEGYERTNDVERIVHALIYRPEYRFRNQEDSTASNSGTSDEDVVVTGNGSEPNSRGPTPGKPRPVAVDESTGASVSSVSAPSRGAGLAPAPVGATPAKNYTTTSSSIAAAGTVSSRTNQVEASDEDQTGGPVPPQILNPSGDAENGHEGCTSSPSRRTGGGMHYDCSPRKDQSGNRNRDPPPTRLIVHHGIFDLLHFFHTFIGDLSTIESIPDMQKEWKSLVGNRLVLYDTRHIMRAGRNHIFKYRDAGMSLGVLYDFFCPDEPAQKYHFAGGDAEMTARVFRKMLEKSIEHGAKNSDDVAKYPELFGKIKDATPGINSAASGACSSSMKKSSKKATSSGKKKRTTRKYGGGAGKKRSKKKSKSDRKERKASAEDAEDGVASANEGDEDDESSEEEEESDDEPQQPTVEDQLQVFQRYENCIAGYACAPQFFRLVPNYS
ncbi:unnamed protein product [Amoebophrya sp. A25]|nr:unnamed protein product [Amoebophrya sp. A25]|eukprot:GSA25T00013966001.1